MDVPRRKTLNPPVRHILSLSGGKDSTALAIYMRDRVPEMEYVFCDTKKELPETYEYLDKIEALLGKNIVRLCAERGFDHWLEIFGNFLPSSQMRWCTKMLKIKPFEQYVGEDNIYMYIAIRADEDREAYISSKPNIRPVYPFREDGVTRDDVFQILRESGLGLPKYYEWRTRSGCYFCFFQRKMEWVGLLENHPDLYELAMQYERDGKAATGYTWCQSESLAGLRTAARIQQIKENHEKEMANENRHRPNRPLAEILEEVYDIEDDDEPCFFCHS
jgi:3'-phosphoadenosine 5'-phosphosulfate sulfotransferase (PAPS reductase)/FAD synthetase